MGMKECTVPGLRANVGTKPHRTMPAFLCICSSSIYTVLINAVSIYVVSFPPPTLLSRKSFLAPTPLFTGESNLFLLHGTDHHFLAPRVFGDKQEVTARVLLGVTATPCCLFKGIVQRIFLKVLNTKSGLFACALMFSTL
jgi:hypothetical protein